MSNKAVSNTPALSILPSVDELLNQSLTAELIEELGREPVVALVRALTAKKRSDLSHGGPSNPIPDRLEIVAELVDELAMLAAAERLRGVRRVINATGVVIHTNLGRAPLSHTAIAAMADAAGYSTIEYDLSSGSRGGRGGGVVELLKILTGAEDAIVVNNCAAAALMVLTVLAEGREVIVSRGELVEIGGDFRIPDILTRSGAVLREVGTTNRTHLRDYENALCDRTAMILKVHPSNFRITGFTKVPAARELAELARSSNTIFYEDAGSGALTDLVPLGIDDEPMISEVVAGGADLVSFSGDKLLGGPQAGIIVGRADLIGRIRKDPLYRAHRLDKVITAALEATLKHYARGTADRDVPVLRMLTASENEIAERAARLREHFEPGENGERRLNVELVQGLSAVGGGAAPEMPLRTTLIALTHTELTADELGARLRKAKVPIISRIEHGRVLLDLRTVEAREEPEILAALTDLLVLP